MATKFLSLIFFLSIFIYTPSVAAQGLPSDVAIPIMGVNCGRAGEAPYNRCCNIPNPKGQWVGVKFGNEVIDNALSMPNLIINALMEGVVGNVQKAFITNDLKNERGEQYLHCPSGTKMSVSDANDPTCICFKEDRPPLSSLKGLCKNISSEKERESCRKCVEADNPEKKAGVWTGLGCVYSDTAAFVKNTVFGFGIGLAGVFSFFCIIYAAFSMQISGGNPDKIKAAQELLTSCITGLMLILFSVFILRLIGVDILRLPGIS